MTLFLLALHCAVCWYARKLRNALKPVSLLHSSPPLPLRLLPSTPPCSITLKALCEQIWAGWFWDDAKKQLSCLQRTATEMLFHRPDSLTHLGAARTERLTKPVFLECASWWTAVKALKRSKLLLQPSFSLQHYNLVCVRCLCCVAIRRTLRQFVLIRVVHRFCFHLPLLSRPESL